MKFIAALFSLLFCCETYTQSLIQFDGRWAFTGLRTTVFRIENKSLYIGMLEYADTSNFARFLRMESLDPSIFSLASVKAAGDTIIIEASFSKIDHDLKLMYLPRDSSAILYVGDVFFDSTRMIVPNRNCSTIFPVCYNRLYRKEDIALILGLKAPELFLRDDAFEFLVRLNEKLKSKCNRCYAGFTDAYMNEVLIEMGFNPVTKHTSNKSIWYNTSGFTFFLMRKFKDDKRISQLTEQVFDWYIRNR